MGADSLTARQRRALTRGQRPIQYFAEDYWVYRRRGLTHREIAAVMGYGSKLVVERLVSRARAAGLLPRPNRWVTP